MTPRPSSGWELALSDPSYPACLAESPRPPAVLYGMGETGLLRPGLAVVGSRRATPYGRACARMFGGWAAERGVVIVSGAATGCDQAAHEAALEAGGQTVAVLGCGADVDYPSSARRLLTILRASGAVVAEAAWGTPPAPYLFPERNRIIAALAAVVLIVEAGMPSGTLTTAEHADAANRLVLAVPGSVFFENSRGCNTLIRDGVQPVLDVCDLEVALRSAGLLEGARGAKLPDACPDLTGLDASERALAAALLADPMRPDDAARELGREAIGILRTLGLLESRSIVARYPDGRYGPCPRT